MERVGEGAANPLFFRVVLYRKEKMLLQANNTGKSENAEAEVDTKLIC